MQAFSFFHFCCSHPSTWIFYTFHLTMPFNRSAPSKCKCDCAISSGISCVSFFFSYVIFISNQSSNKKKCHFMMISAIFAGANGWRCTFSRLQSLQHLTKCLLYCSLSNSILCGDEKCFVILLNCIFVRQNAIAINVDMLNETWSDCVRYVFSWKISHWLRVWFGCSHQFDLALQFVPFSLGRIQLNANTNP